MLRRTRRIVIFLLLGAIVNIAVAWGCACIGTTAGHDESTATQWPIEMPDDWPEHPQSLRVFRGLVLSAHSYDAWTNSPGLSGWMDRWSVIRFQCGWPMKSMQRTVYDSMAQARGTLDHWPDRTHGVSVSGINAPGSFIRQDEWRFRRRLPLNPLVPAFLINTLFYALLLWLLFAFPFALRRRLRLRRGHCPHCNYPFGESPTCTECGRDRAPHGNAVLTPDVQ